MIEFLKGLLFVRKCIFCGEVLTEKTDSVFCPKCRLEYEKLKRVPCRICGKKQTLCRCMPENDSGLACSAVHLFEYDDELSRRILFLLKRKNLRVLQQFLSREIAFAISGALGDDVSHYSITFAPRAPKSIRVYGFDQAKRLCRGISGALGIPMVELFRHRRYSEQQKRLNAEARGENARKSYELHHGFVQKTKGLIIVDDVITTGSTVMTLSLLAREAGFSEILIATAARTPYWKKEKRKDLSYASSEKKSEKQTDEL